MASDLAAQLSPWQGERVLAIDPFIDRASGEQTGISKQLQEGLAAALVSTVEGLRRSRFDEEGLGRSRLVLTGTLTAAEGSDSFAASVSLTDRTSGLVIAQSAARFREGGLDASPTGFYRDSPSFVRDRSVDAYVRTAGTPAGQLADPLYVAQLPTSALLSEALAAYNEGLWEAALTAYAAAAKRPDGMQLRTLNGIYLGNLRLGRLDAAEEAFGRIVTYGLETNNLAMKILFLPNATEFWPGEELGRMYPMWLRQIARLTATSERCLNIVGHTSRTGTEGYNETLSLQRAEAIRHALESQSPELVGHLRSTGMGWRENVIGNGADDASDAVDRRVEFLVVRCVSDSN